MYEPEKIYVQNAGGIDAGVAALMQNANKSADSEAMVSVETVTLLDVQLLN